MRSMAFVLIGLGAVACDQAGGAAPKPASLARTSAAQNECAVSRNDEIRQLLAPSCAACHSAMSNRPFFATAESFDDLLVYDPRYVIPGNPDGSYLVQLIEGRAQGAYKQMPISGEAFAVLDQKGSTKISLRDIKDWIKNLPAQNPRGAGPSPDAPMTRRLTAEEMVLSMRRLLGLPETGVTLAGGVNLGMRASDAAYAPGEDQSQVGPSYAPGPAPFRFEALGGPNSLMYRQRVKELSPATLQTIIQVSQDWCGSAVARPGNTALFKYASANSSSAKDAAAIQKNLAYLYLRFLGDVPTDQAVSDLLHNLFVKYEAGGPAVAWTAVCASLIRHPQFMLF